MKLITLAYASLLSTALMGQHQTSAEANDAHADMVRLENRIVQLSKAYGEQQEQLAALTKAHEDLLNGTTRAKLLRVGRIELDQGYLTTDRDHAVILSNRTGSRVYLHPGGAHVRSTGAYQFAVQADGNVVLYKNDAQAIWSSGTNGR